MNSEDFNSNTASEAALALQEVLAARTHKKKMWGQEIIVPGQLGEALKLPAIISQLNSKVAKRRAKGLERFQDLWSTLSSPTQDEVLTRLGWYNPKELDWEDPRSNRRPKILPSSDDLSDD